MMKGLKKQGAILLLLVFVFPIMVPMASFEDIGETGNETVIRVLTALGFMNSETDQYFYPNDPITRGEACEIFSGLKGDFTPNVNENHIYYQDVLASHPHYQEIIWCLKSGVISAGSTFRPDESLTFQEAVAMTLNLLGYSPVAKAQGGYPTGYVVVAGDNLLLKNLSYGERTLTKSEFARLIYNALFVELIEGQYFYGDHNAGYAKTGETILSRRDIYQIKGLIHANETTSIYPTGRAADLGKFKIENLEITDEDHKGKSLLGHMVEAYYHLDENDNKTLLYLEESPNKKETFSAKDLSSYTLEKGSITFYVDRNGEEKKLVTASNAVVIVNGKSMVPTLDFLENFHTGEITLINNGAKELPTGYSVVLVKSYENFVVSTVTPDKIYFKTGTYGGLPYLEYDEDKTTILSKGKKIEFSEVKVGDALSIAGNAQGFYEAVASSQSMNGIISQLSGTGKDASVILNGTAYPITMDCHKESSYQPGDAVLAVVNFLGSIVYLGSEKSRNYGVIIQSAYENEFTPFQIKVLTESGKSVILEADEKIKYNVNEAQGKAPVFAAIKNLSPQLISYEVNKKGAITAIYTALASTGDLWADREQFTLHYTETASVRATAVSLGEKIFTSGAIIFQIANPIDGKYDEESFKVGKGSLVAGNYYKDIQAYDMGINGCAKAILILQTAQEGFTSDVARPLFLVDRITNTIDQDGTPVKKLYGYEGGIAKEAYLSPKAKKVYTDRGFNHDISTLDFGDILIYETDYTGSIAKYAIVYKENAATKGEGRLLAVGSGYLYAQHMEILRGSAGLFDTKIFPIMTKEKGFVTTLLRTKVFKVPVVNRSLGRITLVSIDEVNKPGYGFAYPGDEIIARGNYGEMFELIVYRDQ